MVNTAPYYYNVDDTCSLDLTQSMSLTENRTFDQDGVQFTGNNSNFTRIQTDDDNILLIWCQYGVKLEIT